MKEGVPEIHFHHQEERRLYYVALTRAQDRLTITSLAERKAKVPPFIEDILMDPRLKRRDVLQLAPRVAPAPAEVPDEGETEEAQDSLLCHQPSQSFLAHRSLGEDVSSAVARATAIASFGGAKLPILPQKYLFSSIWSLQEGPKATLTFGRVMHGTIRRMMAEFKKGNRLPFDEVQRIYETEWSRVGYEDEYQEGSTRRMGWSNCEAFTKP